MLPYGGYTGGISRYGGGYGYGSSTPSVSIPQFQRTQVSLPEINLSRSLPRLDEGSFSIPPVTIGPTGITPQGVSGGSRLPLYLGGAIVVAVAVMLLKGKKGQKGSSPRQ